MSDLLTIDQLRALPGPEEFDGGVYFLWDSDELVYIGGAININQRAYYQANVNRLGKLHQSRNKPIKHDRLTALVMVKGRIKEGFDRGTLDDLEQRYIDTYPTKYNDHECIRRRTAGSPR